MHIILAICAVMYGGVYVVLVLLPSGEPPSHKHDHDEEYEQWPL